MTFDGVQKHCLVVFSSVIPPQGNSHPSLAVFLRPLCPGWRYAGPSHYTMVEAGALRFNTPQSELYLALRSSSSVSDLNSPLDSTPHLHPTTNRSIVEAESLASAPTNRLLDLASDCIDKMHRGLSLTLEQSIFGVRSRTHPMIPLHDHHPTASRQLQNTSDYINTRSSRNVPRRRIILLRPQSSSLCVNP
jgi:hypothetical protein